MSSQISGPACASTSCSLSSCSSKNLASQSGQSKMTTSSTGSVSGFSGNLGAKMEQKIELKVFAIFARIFGLFGFGLFYVK